MLLLLTFKKGKILYGTTFLYLKNCAKYGLDPYRRQIWIWNFSKLSGFTYVLPSAEKDAQNDGEESQM
jgi:hypothetical protein